ncbi:MAG: hypothetical protein AAF587_40640 [Bacteroidota bacterium]
MLVLVLSSFTTYGYFSIVSRDLALCLASGLKTYLADVQQFEDGNTIGDDYAYDYNGNLTQDLNKGISSISYNHLNKPTSVVPGIAKNLAYIYSAPIAQASPKAIGISQAQLAPNSGKM